MWALGYSRYGNVHRDAGKRYFYVHSQMKIVENGQLCTQFGQKRETLQATEFGKNFIHSPSFYERNS